MNSLPLSLGHSWDGRLGLAVIPRHAQHEGDSTLRLQSPSECCLVSPGSTSGPRRGAIHADLKPSDLAVRLLECSPQRIGYWIASGVRGCSHPRLDSGWCGTRLGLTIPGPEHSEVGEVRDHVLNVVGCPGGRQSTSTQVSQDSSLRLWLLDGR